ncbi:homoserine kinase [Pedobacter montanisoli]|uniref:Homoserine kinase n=1 Tax=Pedobacter montanisoli TaxID=2923277 RepID=A0ABS9ZU24_9SPHI|nr:homoserine kinase [Pedobacter montanisoli]MCJ0742110.1 homoserine kinase [Pedobacter montanisoli]
MKKQIKVFAPATVANVVCGFDVLGFAVNEPGDEVEMTLTDQPGVKIVQITGDNGKLPLESHKNTVSVSVQHYLKHINREDVGVEITLHKKMPIGSGLGSSSASTVAGLFAINQLMGSRLTAKELIPFAMKGEELACGYGHADNVAPALMGGFVLIRSYDPLDIISLPVPTNLHAAIVYPEVDVPTKDARQMIRTKIQLKDAVTQWGNVAGLVSGLFLDDLDLVGRSMKDVLVEPFRSILIPGFEELRNIAIENGAVGFGISGSGPSVFALTKDSLTARKITDLQQAHLTKMKINSSAFVSAVNTEGPKLL